MKQRKQKNKSIILIHDLDGIRYQNDIFHKQDIDRFNIELGTSSIFDENNSLVKNRFKVTTNFKL